MAPKTSKNPESVVKEIKRKTRRKFNPEEKIRIILEGLKGEDSISSICRDLCTTHLIRSDGLIDNLHFW